MRACVVCGDPIINDRSERPRHGCGKPACTRELKIRNLRKHHQQRRAVPRMPNQRTWTWTWDGWMASDWRATRNVCDDYGQVRKYRRCVDCRSWREENYDNFSTKGTDGPRVTAWDPKCRPCRLVHNKRIADARSPEAKREIERRKHEKLLADPEARERDRYKKRAYRARHHERVKEQQRRRVKAAWARLQADPKRHAAHLESRRMAYRLRRERQEGVNVVSLYVRKAPPRGPTRSDEHISRLPAKPLAEYIFRRLAGTGQDATEFCVDLGMSERLDRMLYAWKVGEREAVNFDVADTIITRLSVNWWDVWADGDDYLAAQRAFEGDPLEAVA